MHCALIGHDTINIFAAFTAVYVRFKHINLIYTTYSAYEKIKCINIIAAVTGFVVALMLNLTGIISVGQFRLLMMGQYSPSNSQALCVCVCVWGGGGGGGLLGDWLYSKVYK